MSNDLRGEQRLDPVKQTAPPPATAPHQSLWGTA
jgi:hypothetical protein